MSSFEQARGRTTNRKPRSPGDDRLSGAHDPPVAYPAADDACEACEGHGSDRGGETCAACHGSGHVVPSAWICSTRLP